MCIRDSYHPDIFISINGNAYYEFVDSEILELLKGFGCQTYLWYMDTIKRFEAIKQNVCAFDGVWSFEPMDVKYIESKYSRKAKYLPIGVAEQIFCKGKEQKQIKYDISFIGNSTDNRLEVLDELAKYCVDNNKNMVVYGHYWHNKHWWQEYTARKKFAKKHPNLIKYVKNSFLHNKEVAELYNMSKICLNIHISVHKGINPRTFEVLGNGNFELCDYRSDAESMGLYDGENIVFYKDANDCINKLDYYLQNEEERKKIADAGQMFVKQKYTMEKLLEGVLKEEKIL